MNEPTREEEIEQQQPAPLPRPGCEEEAKPVAPRWRPAAEPTCCGSGCSDCPF
ncbi:MAG TPA: hypothetical protein VGF48_16035 [Thermoanaerobaculia bacterium]